MGNNDFELSTSICYIMPKQNYDRNIYTENCFVKYGVAAALSTILTV